MKGSMEEKAGLFMRLHEIVSILRGPGGCPWDREQTHESLRSNLLEETYEVLETIDEKDAQHLREELGDLLLQVMMHAQMEEECGTFDVFDVIKELNDKLIRRHPHVFGQISAEDADQALKNWEQMKREEKRRKGDEPESVLSGIPKPLPSLLRAVKLQKKASRAGLDFAGIEEVFGKVEEEWNELKEALSSEDAAALKEEVGDVLFAVVNAARFLRIDPDEALALANRKFEERVKGMEQALISQGLRLEQASREDLDRLWNDIKKGKKREYKENYG